MLRVSLALLIARVFVTPLLLGLRVQLMLRLLLQLQPKMLQLQTQCRIDVMLALLMVFLLLLVPVLHPLQPLLKLLLLQRQELHLCRQLLLLLQELLLLRSERLEVQPWHAIRHGGGRLATLPPEPTLRRKHYWGSLVATLGALDSRCRHQPHSSYCILFFPRESFATASTSSGVWEAFVPPARVNP